MPVISFNKYTTTIGDTDKMVEVKNKERMQLRKTNKYKFLIKELRRIYNIDAKRIRAEGQDYKGWNEFAHEQGIYYVVEQNQDIIDLKNGKMIDDIFAGRFYRFNYESDYEEE